MSQLGQHPSIVMPQNTEYAKEMQKHEAFPTQYGPGKRPYVYYEFPKRLYKAVRRDEGGIGYEGVTVHDDTEALNMRSRGYHAAQADALTALEREQLVHGQLAAERNFEIQHGRISERAAGEVRAAEAEHGARHLPEVAAKPIRRRGPNKKKVVADV